MEKINHLKSEIIRIGQELWMQGFTPANAGNISVRLADGTLLCTPTRISKSMLTKEAILQLDSHGSPLDPNTIYAPSSEIKLHLEVYRQRPDILAVIHAHPPFATTFASLGEDLSRNILPEATLQIGTIPVARYGTPSTSELSDSIIAPLHTSDVILLENHGCIAVAHDLKTAQFRLEILEHYCKILFNLKMLGKTSDLTEEQVKKLIELRSKMQIPGRALIQSAHQKVQFPIK